ncbi:hypothetical protein [Methylotenera sp. 1P/1]|uniref:dCTP deaminase domain-containing protein n=1 Tax=Methylotenera sp. 1P/1 TaxID=1131551 RepID=UPI000371FA8B|nr:hypothetical protein [Methylotenera sp. 1P/1]
MSYWSGEKLHENIKTYDLIKPFNSESIDCASYTLHVGDEAFVSKDLINNENSIAIKQNLAANSSENQLNIRPGQFAFLLTFETVTMPDDAIGFISIKSKYKFKGLVNVSGFHVDPGYSGKLIFGVYNAGPMPIILERLEPVFLIFYADLDRTSNKTYTSKSKTRKEIGSDLIQNMAGQVFSPLMLQRKMERLEDAQVELDKNQSTLVAKTKILSGIFWFGLSILLAAAAFNSIQAILGGWIIKAIEANVAYRKDTSFPNVLTIPIPSTTPLTYPTSALPATSTTPDVQDTLTLPKNSNSKALP